MLAKKDKIFNDSLISLVELSEDEEFRMRCEAREDQLKQERDMKAHYEQIIAEQAKLIANLQAQLESK